MDNRRTVTFLVSIILAMFGLAYASVPLYSIFCKVTGFGGTVKRLDFENLKDRVGFKTFTVRFNADVAPNLPWKFSPEQSQVEVVTGRTGLAFYKVQNLSDKDIAGIAIYNVTPHKVAKYFSKVACFCFTRQVLPAKRTVFMPVTFIIDPDIEKDPEVSEVSTITLSYSFMHYED